MNNTITAFSMNKRMTNERTTNERTKKIRTLGINYNISVTPLTIFRNAIVKMSWHVSNPNNQIHHLFKIIFFFWTTDGHLTIEGNEQITTDDNDDDDDK